MFECEQNYVCKSPEGISSTLCDKKSIIECFLDYSYDQFNILIFEFDLIYNINVYWPPQKSGFHLRHPVVTLTFDKPSLPASIPSSFLLNVVYEWPIMNVGDGYCNYFWHEYRDTGVYLNKEGKKKVRSFPSRNHTFSWIMPLGAILETTFMQ